MSKSATVKRGHEARERRKKVAADREAGGSPEPGNQLKNLDKRLGKGVGAKKERARLAAEVEKMENKNSKKTSRKGKKS